MFNIPENCNKLYLDVGLSYCAPNSGIWLQKDLNAFVIGFEPSPEAVFKIYNEVTSYHRKLLKKDFNRFHLEQMALSNVIEETTMNLYRPKIDVGCSSLFKPKFTDVLGDVVDCTKVKVDSLSNFFNKNLWLWEKFDRIEYIKIDSQGSDLNIIKGLNNILIEKVVWLTAEGDGDYYEETCSEKNSCSNNNIAIYLEEIGFIKYDHPNTNDPTYYNPRFEDYLEVYIEQE